MLSSNVMEEVQTLIVLAFDALSAGVALGNGEADVRILATVLCDAVSIGALAEDGGVAVGTPPTMSLSQLASTEPSQRAVAHSS